MGSLFEAID